MELNELKDLWQDEKMRLEKRLEINEKLLQKMNLDKVVGDFDKLLTRSILGRNLALVYCLISLFMSWSVLDEFEYSIPCLVGGFAMFGSFILHLAIPKPDYTQLSILDLQKIICDFRIHIAKTAIYDKAIVLFWFLTYIPICFRLIAKIYIYSDFNSTLTYFFISIVISILSIVPFKNVYKEYENKLRATEKYLAEIIEFEKA